MCEREQRGLLIAATARITRKGNAWIVPSSSGVGKYVVCPHPEQPTCSCPDHETRGCKCKHIFAVEFAMKREENPDGTETIISEAVVTEVVKKATYPQKWSAYNAAQVNEKDKFLQLLHDLTRAIPDPPHGKGRKPLPLASAIFSACYKVYSTVSGRRFMSDMRDAQARGYVEACPCYNSIFNYLDNPEVTPILKALIAESSLSLKTVEVDFAVDSSSFSTCRFDRWFDEKWGKQRSKNRWIKLQAMVGVKTNVITAVELPEHDGSDSPYMPALVRATAKGFKISTVSADKGYSGVANHEVVAEAGGVPFIAFKSCATGGSGGLWQKMFHYFSFRREDFLRFYHKRSNVESTFAMLKAKFGDSLRSKSDVSMRNELLCKVLCHNICCIISAMYELGIEPSFWAELSPAQELPA
jgi:transposase